MGGGILEGNPDNPHESRVTDAARMFDAASWFNPDEINPHTYAPAIMEGINTVFSPITGFVEDTLNFTTPGKQWLEKQVPILGQWSDTMRNRPGDAAAIAASMYGGAAAGGALSGGATSGAGTGGTLGASGSTAATSAVTPSFASGAGMTAAYTPSAIQSAAGLGGTGIGTLGSAGTTAALNGLTPAFESAGGAAGGSYLGQLYDQAKTAYDWYGNAQDAYNALNPQQQQQQDLNQPIQLVNNFVPSRDPRRFIRGY